MARIRGRSGFSIGPVAVAFFCMVSAAQSGQQIPGFFDIFSGLINTAIVDEARRDWQTRPLSDYNCLARHGVSADQLANRGVGPKDPRVRQILSQCVFAAPAAPVPVALQPARNLIAGPPNPNYVVNGLSLGAPFDPQSDPAAGYACHASDDYTGFTWCQSHHAESRKFGLETIWMSVFRSETNAAVEITEVVDPALFQKGDAEREIQRLSHDFGQQARIIAADLPSGGRAVIAVWGAVNLTTLDTPTLDALRRGAPVHSGLLVGVLGDPRASARLGLPVYSLGGGAGFIWSADYNSAGKGVLRIIAVNPSALNSATKPQPVVGATSPVTAPTVAPEPPSTPAPNPEDAARRERERADHLEKVVAAAKRQLDDAAQFLKEDPQNPKLLDYVDRIAALNAAAGQSDPDDIERKMANLSAALANDKDYQQFAVALDKRRSEAEAQHLSDAIQLARDQHDFLVVHVSKNPLAPEVATLMPLIKQIGPALDKPSLDQLQPLTDQIGNAIREAKLDDAFRAAQVARANQAAPPAPQPSAQPPSPPLPITEKNRFLIEGDLADVVALYNAGAKAPHVALNLRGEFDFTDDRANVCLFGLNPDGVDLTIRSMLAPYHLKAVTGLDQPCDSQRLDAYDVVAMQRGAFLKSTQIDALSLIKQIEIGAMRKFALVSAADQAAASAAERAAIEQISTDVAADAKTGFGVILLKTGSPNLCGVVGDKVEAHKLLILKNADKLTFDMQLAPVIAVESAEDAFAGAQKARCGAIYASAADLKTIGDGLAHAAIPFSFSSLWIASSELDAKDAEVAEKHRLEEQRAAKAAQDAADEARLADQRAKDLGATWAAQQATLRTQYDGSAKAAVAAIVADVTSWGQGQPAGVDYPTYAAWLAEMKADHWEIMSTDSDVQDYGTSDFKGRPLDTALARVKIRLKNAILGEYKDACFVFGRIVDPEFNMTREPFVAGCDDEGAIKLWQTGHDFHSRWIVGELPSVSSPSAPAISGSSSPPAQPILATDGLPSWARSAMLVATGDDPQHPIVTLGTAVWSLIPPATGHPATVAVKAEADIPDLKMHATMTLRKNTDPTLQATQTIDLKFSFADRAPITGFKDIGLPQMRKEDSTAAEALTSVKIKISDVYFLIALAKGDSDTARNLDLMQTRAWFDFPLLLNDDRIAKIVFQKSPEGEAMLEKAVDAWKSETPALPAKAPIGEALPTIEDSPQYKFAREVERSPVTSGSDESRYLTTVYGMIKAHLHETAELHLEMATQRGVIDFYVDEGGTLVGRKLVNSSGSPNLDVAVMEAIAVAGPYPAPPNWQPVSLAYNFGKKPD